jgi:hypothetical protein
MSAAAAEAFSSGIGVSSWKPLQNRQAGHLSFISVGPVAYLRNTLPRLVRVLAHNDSALRTFFETNYVCLLWLIRAGSEGFDKTGFTFNLEPTALCTY